LPVTLIITMGDKEEKGKEKEEEKKGKEEEKEKEIEALVKHWTGVACNARRVCVFTGKAHCRPTNEHLLALCKLSKGLSDPELLNVIRAAAVAVAAAAAVAAEVAAAAAVRCMCLLWTNDGGQLIEEKVEKHLRVL